MLCCRMTQRNTNSRTQHAQIQVIKFAFVKRAMGDLLGQLFLYMAPSICEPQKARAEYTKWSADAVGVSLAVFSEERCRNWR